MNQSPNIFKYATSELSQDAVICYFAKWADSEFSGPMHDFGIAFVNALLEKKGFLNTKIQQVEVFKQVDKIDVLLEVNDNEFAVIIEDKTVTHNHSNQLRNHYKYVTHNKKNKKYTNIVPIYFKTYDQCSYEYLKNIEDPEQKEDPITYYPFLRSDLLPLMRLWKEKMQ